jgi:hypothetical protein
MANNKEIKDGIYGYVSGTAGRSFTTKNGRAFEMEVKDPKAQYGDKWTIWGDLPANEGDRVTVKGWLSIIRETYEKEGETKVGIKRAVNKPELAAHEPATGPQAAHNAPGQQSSGHGAPAPQIAAEPWDVAQGGYSDPTPF